MSNRILVGRVLPILVLALAVMAMGCGDGKRTSRTTQRRKVFHPAKTPPNGSQAQRRGQVPPRNQQRGGQQRTLPDVDRNSSARQNTIEGAFQALKPQDKEIQLGQLPAGTLKLSEITTYLKNMDAGILQKSLVVVSGNQVNLQIQSTDKTGTFNGDRVRKLNIPLAFRSLGGGSLSNEVTSSAVNFSTELVLQHSKFKESLSAATNGLSLADVLVSNKNQTEDRKAISARIFRISATQYNVHVEIVESPESSANGMLYRNIILTYKFQNGATRADAGTTTNDDVVSTNVDNSLDVEAPAPTPVDVSDPTYQGSDLRGGDNGTTDAPAASEFCIPETGKECI